MLGLHTRPTRRAFLASALATAGIVVSAQTQEIHYHASSHEMPMDSAFDPVRQALRKKVLALSGLTPGQYLTAFDYGKVSTAHGRTVREFELTAAETTIEIAPGIHFPAWTYNRSVPGPILRCTEGDTIRVRFMNRSAASHTIHFHGIHPASMDGVYEPVGPGQEYVYEFAARPSGVQFYHCHTAPVGLHMNRGLFGPFIIDPRTPRPPGQEMVMVLHGWDIDFDGKNELYAINGGANYYRDNPISLSVGELVRIYLINALEYEPLESFHIHANVFRLYRTGSETSSSLYADMVALTQAERCILEFTYTMPGRYMFHSHRNHVAELGCMGDFVVSA